MTVSVHRSHHRPITRLIFATLAVLLALQGPGAWAVSSLAASSAAAAGPRPLTPLEMAGVMGGQAPTLTPPDCTNNGSPAGCAEMPGAVDPKPNPTGSPMQGRGNNSPYNSMQGAPSIGGTCPLPGTPSGPSGAPSCPLLGDPVDISHGTPVLSYVDVSLPMDGGLFFGYMRTYDTRKFGSIGNTQYFGDNWTGSCEVRLFQSGAYEFYGYTEWVQGDVDYIPIDHNFYIPTNMILRDHGGRYLNYNLQSGWTYDLEYVGVDALGNWMYDPVWVDADYNSQVDQGNYSMVRIHHDLENNHQYTTYAADMGGGMSVDFNRYGRATRFNDNDGHWVQYNYRALAPEALVSQITSSDGRELNFTYIDDAYDNIPLRITDENGNHYVEYSYGWVTGTPNLYSLQGATFRNAGGTSGGTSVQYEYDVLPNDNSLHLTEVQNHHGDTIVEYTYAWDTVVPQHYRVDTMLDGDGNLLLDWIGSPGGNYQSIYDVYHGSTAVRYTYTFNYHRDVVSVERSGVGVPDFLVDYLGTTGIRPSQRRVHVRYNPNGTRMTYTYDESSQNHYHLGNVLRIDYTGGDFETYAYYPNIHGEANFLTSHRDRLGDITRWQYDTYDISGNMTTVTYPTGLQATYAYDADGRVIAHGDPLGRITTTAYNDLGLVTSTRDHLGSYTTIQYDSHGNATTVTDPLGNQTETSYDSLGRRVRVDYPTGVFATWGYDAVGNVTTATNARGYVTTIAYDAQNRVARVHDALGGVTRYFYTRDDQIGCSRDAGGAITTYAFDTQGRVVSHWNDNLEQHIFEYNDNGCSSCGGGVGQVARSRNPRGEWTTYSYDNEGQLTSVEFDDGERLTYVYDSGTHLLDSLIDTRLILGNGAFQYDYDDDRRPVRVIEPDGAVISYAYDEYGRRQSITDPDGNVTCYVYNANGQLTQVRNGFGQVTTYSYDSYGRLVGQENWNGTSTTRGYDTYGRMNHLVNRLANGEVGQRVQYAFDANGNVTRTTFAHHFDHDLDVDEIIYARYTYDALDRLTCEEWRLIEDYSFPPQAWADSQLWQRQYAYDAVGNRTLMSWESGVGDGGVTYTYNNLNQLTSMSSGTYRYFRYDANGNLIARTTELNGSVGWFYTWTQGDRMARAYLVLDAKVGEHRGTTFVYDSGGRRLLRHDDDGTWTRYFYDGLNVLLERESTYDPSTWDEFIAMDAEDGSTSDWLTNATTTVSNVWNDERMGRIIQTSNPTVGSTGALVPGAYNWDETNKTVTMAIQRAESGIWTVRVRATVSLNPTMSISLYYDSWHTTVNEFQSGHIAIGVGEPLGGAAAAESDWWVLSRDLEEDIHLIYPGYSVIDVDSVTISRNDLRIDDIHLTDARTTRIFTLAPSALGGIISARDVAETGPNTDTWYHYDRLGNVMLTTDSDGASNGLRWQDANGNQLASETTGSWATAAAADGYGLTTKEYDGDVELYYFWQRWYDPTVGRFISFEPSRLQGPNFYHFNFNSPASRIDIDGNASVLYPGGHSLPTWLWGIQHLGDTRAAYRCWGLAIAASEREFPEGPNANSPQDAMRHCVLACCLRQHYAFWDAWQLLVAHEPTNPWSYGPAEHMDTFNNLLGMGFGERSGRNGGIACCNALCKDAVRRGIAHTGQDDPRWNQ